VVSVARIEPLSPLGVVNGLVKSGLLNRLLFEFAFLKVLSFVLTLLS
jgi:hypothetical protein